VLAGAIKAIAQFVRCWRWHKDSVHVVYSDTFDLLVSLLAIVGLSNAAFFQGVLSDIPVESGHAWINKSLVLVISAALLFGVQMAFILLRKSDFIKNCRDQMEK